MTENRCFPYSIAFSKMPALKSLFLLVFTVNFLAVVIFYTHTVHTPLRAASRASMSITILRDAKNEVACNCSMTTSQALSLVFALRMLSASTMPRVERFPEVTPL